MKIFTSYYSNFNKIPKKYLCIGISRYIPKEFQTTEIDNFLYTPKNILAPSEELLSDIKQGKISQEEYARRYYTEVGQGIRRLGFSNSNEYFAKMVSTFEAYNDGGFEALVLMCYEKPHEFCHRHLLSALMRKNGFDVTELGSKQTISSKEDTMSSPLF